MQHHDGQQHGGRLLLHLLLPVQPVPQGGERVHQPGAVPPIGPGAEPVRQQHRPPGHHLRVHGLVQSGRPDPQPRRPGQDGGRLSFHVQRQRVCPPLRRDGRQQQRLHVLLHPPLVDAPVAELDRRPSRRRDQLCLRRAAQSHQGLPTSGDCTQQEDDALLGQLCSHRVRSFTGPALLLGFQPQLILFTLNAYEILF